ncbi:hypothetical protein [Companilactobacillus metriopterae]|uniref:hypothetical protein n=1 Tax=Companilactobacillus metriopterae TaxID=1909267 RepID=UPI00100C1EAE|nr:hypothetical protein [Companilactobacillus metriopterae]
MNNRELAILILASLFLTIAIFNKDIKESIAEIIKSISEVIKEPAFNLLFTYQIFCLTILTSIILKFHIDLWIIKDYIIMIIFSISPLIIYVNKENGMGKFKKEILKSFTVSGLLIFITNQYTFSLLTEIIINFSLLILISEIAKNINKKTKTFIDIIISILGIVIIVHSLQSFVTDLSNNMSILIFINYFSVIIFWIINIPLILSWKYISQLDTLENFLIYRKTSYTLYKNFNILIFSKVKYSYLKINEYIISNIQQGGLIKKCYLISIKQNYSIEDIDNIIKIFKTCSGKKDLYGKFEVSIFIPFAIKFIDEKGNNIKSWIAPDIKPEYLKMVKNFESFDII